MQQYTREIQRSFQTGPHAELGLRLGNGAVRLCGEDRQDVTVFARATFLAESDEAAAAVVRALEAGFRQDGSHLRAHLPDIDGGLLSNLLRGPIGEGGRLEVDLEVAAPHDTSAEVHVVNGHVAARGISGDSTIHIVNGPLELEDIGGEVTVRLINGRASLLRIGGDVSVTLTSGPLRIEGAAGDVNFAVVNAQVSVTDPDADVSGRAVNGTIELTGRITGDVSLENAHGSIVLNAPADSRFELDATSQLGSVDSELSVRDESHGHGGHLPSVSLRSQTGNISLRALDPAGATQTPAQPV
ncbi:MAG TPA: DUF4097 family beta strand repeat-containing protein [Dehalococcoidia bacterium]|nr:DUF4097 family beta strand repeat-containing protein [Dehalococcoidia bacterium]